MLNLNRKDYEGKISLAEKGYGFISCGDSKDVFIPKNQAIKVFNNEIVKFEIVTIKDRSEGVITDIVKRKSLFVGKVIQGRYENYVQLDPIHKIKINNYYGNGGDIIKFKISVYPDTNVKSEADCIEILGHENSAKIENKLAIFNHEIPYIFNNKVEKEIKEISEDISFENRFDLTDLNFVTIDGEDSRDFDDAVFCEPTDFGWSLYVAIADVAEYVKINSELDKESAIRGNSVYFPNEVIPMLPEFLSNNLCSLNPNKNRYSVTVKINFSKNGDIKSFKFFNSVIKSKARLTYNEVADILELHDDALITKYKAIFKDLKHLYRLYELLKENKNKRGALEFEKRENKITFDKNNYKIESVSCYNRRVSHKIIEECMLSANICAAKLLSKLKIPSLYRVHESPKDTKLDYIKNILKGIGLTLRGKENEKTSSNFKKMLDLANKRDDKEYIYSAILQSMPRASYQVENKGHFGLAYHEYTHFTSPIRRYADLLVHRAIKSVIESNIGDKYVQRKHKTSDNFNDIYPYNAKELEQIALHISQTEKRADKASNEVIDSLKCHFLTNKIGNKYSGIITHLTNNALFVEFDEFILEGIVSYVDLPDYFSFVANSEKSKIKGRKTKKELKLGDKVNFTILKVNNNTNKVYLKLII